MPKLKKTGHLARVCQSQTQGNKVLLTKRWNNLQVNLKMSQTLKRI